jgi:hypothetical protein
MKSIITVEQLKIILSSYHVGPTTIENIVNDLTRNESMEATNTQTIGLLHPICSGVSLAGYIIGIVTTGIGIHYLLPETMSWYSLYWMNAGIILFWWFNRK